MHIQNWKSFFSTLKEITIKHIPNRTNFLLGLKFVNKTAIYAWHHSTSFTNICLEEIISVCVDHAFYKKAECQKNNYNTI